MYTHWIKTSYIHDRRLAKPQQDKPKAQRETIDWSDALKGGTILTEAKNDRVML